MVSGPRQGMIWVAAQVHHGVSCRSRSDMVVGQLSHGVVGRSGSDMGRRVGVLWCQGHVWEWHGSQCRCIMVSHAGPGGQVRE